MRRRRFLFLLFGLTLLLGACNVTVTQPGGVGTPGTSSTLTGTSSAQIHGNTAPDSGTFNSCPAQGDGGDPQLNQLKNRTDSANWVPIPFSQLEQLPWPKSIERRDIATWSQADAATVAHNNGRPVSISGYLASARREGPESPNCHSQTDRDFHIWLVDHPTTDRTHSIVVESTPRVRAKHPGWTLDRLLTLAHKSIQVRISGWTMLDPEHPDQVGQTRGTIWEIHPIMQIEVQQNGGWVPLDSATL
jgi:hypothetical protein